MQRKANHSIEEYFQSFQNGEEKGFAYFFRSYHKQLLYFAQKLVHKKQIAEDIVEDGFLKLLENRCSIQAASTIKPFLYSTIRNACVDKLRREKTQADRSRQLFYLQDEEEQSSLEYLIRTETIALILAAIEELPSATQNVIRLHYLEEKSYDEMAKELNRSKETIRKQKKAGLVFLQKRFPGLKIFLLFFLMQ